MADTNDTTQHIEITCQDAGFGHGECSCVIASAAIDRSGLTSTCATINNYACSPREAIRLVAEKMAKAVEPQ